MCLRMGEPMGEVLREFDLKIKHFKGDQTKEELNYPCEKCLMRNDKMCLVFGMTTGESRRPCISNYRIDQETLVIAMREKCIRDAKAFSDWVNSASEYLDKDDMKMIVIGDASDINRVYDELAHQLGEKDAN